MHSDVISFDLHLKYLTFCPAADLFLHVLKYVVEDSEPADVLYDSKAVFS